MLIKNITAHLDVLHDGRPLPAYETAEVTEKEFALPFYQSRISDGLIIVVPQEEDPSATKRRAKRAPKGASEETT